MKETLINGHIFGRLNSGSALLRILESSFLSLAIVALFLFIPLSLSASEKSIKEALRLLPEQAEKAQQILESLSTDDPHFKTAVEELLKIFYKKQMWDKFFSYAQYYRYRWPVSERSDVQLLEALGLMRHCQNEDLSRLVQEMRRELKPVPAELEQIEALSQTKFRSKAAKNQTPSKLQEHVQGDSLWKTKSKVLGKVHPAKIQIRVSNQCENSGS